LSRDGKEKAIKQTILKEDFIECVILLPEKLFYNTGAPVFLASVYLSILPLAYFEFN